jgi:hypothetical protein
MKEMKRRGGRGWWALGGMIAATLILYIGCYYATVRTIVPTPEQRRQYLRTSNPPTIEREMVSRNEAMPDYPDLLSPLQVRRWLHW